MEQQQFIEESVLDDNKILTQEETLIEENASDMIVKGLTFPWPDKHARIKYTDDTERCAFLIRGLNQCKNKRSDWSSVCIRHDPANLERERLVSTLPKGGRGAMSSKGLRISASQERMFNPLATPLIDPGCIGLPITSWDEMFEIHTNPVHIDIGSARGKLIIELASCNTSNNYIGIEVRSLLVEEAQEKVLTMGQQRKNIQHICGNILSESHRNQLKESLSKLPNITTISILFPDPWIKQKHKPRRVIQLPVLHWIAHILKSGGELIIISDVEDIVKDAKLKLNECEELFSIKQPTEDCTVDPAGYFLYNPFKPFASEREQVCQLLWRRVYRLVYIRK